ncbi:MAG TPA: methyltransferase domain-containing protein [Kofleriaceae bacterium]|nr:methyltransferase domain-containing protein [Kofleriaceae bacterium]
MSGGDQLAYWNGPAAQRWVAYGDAIDRGVAGITSALMALAAPRPGEQVLDVGCGSGATTRTLAERIAPGGAVEGVDISAPLLEVARSRAPELRFTEADAATFEVRVPVQLLFSRFGVMFFADPVAAFDNLRRALAPGGRLVFSCWRTPEENHWATVPMRAARDLLPAQPPADPQAAGPFALADEARLRGILAAAGFARVQLARHDDVMVLGADVAEASEQALGVGPLARVAGEQLAPVRDQIRERVRAVMTQYLGPAGVALPASAWLVEAR